MKNFSHSLNKRIADSFLRAKYSAEGSNKITKALIIPNEQWQKYNELLLVNMPSEYIIPKSKRPTERVDFKFRGDNLDYIYTSIRYFRLLERYSFRRFAEEIDAYGKFFYRDADKWFTANLLCSLLTHIGLNSNLEALEMIYNTAGEINLPSTYSITQEDNGVEFIYKSYLKYLEALGAGDELKKQRASYILGLYMIIRYPELNGIYINRCMQKIAPNENEVISSNAFLQAPQGILKEISQQPPQMVLKKIFSRQKDQCISLKRLASALSKCKELVAKGIATAQIKQDIIDALVCYVKGEDALFVEHQTPPQLGKLYLDQTLLYCYLLKPCALLAATTIGAGLVFGGSIMAISTTALITCSSIGYYVMADLYKTDIVFASMVEQLGNDVVNCWSNRMQNNASPVQAI